MPVYFALSADEAALKVGFSRCPEKRIRSINPPTPGRCRLIGTIGDGGLMAEQAIVRYLRPANVPGHRGAFSTEWFRTDHRRVRPVARWIEQRRSVTLRDFCARFDRILPGLWEGKSPAVQALRTWRTLIRLTGRQTAELLGIDVGAWMSLVYGDREAGPGLAVAIERASEGVVPASVWSYKPGRCVLDFPPAEDA